MLPPVENTPVVLLQWTTKATRSDHYVDVIPMVRKELEQGGILVLPNPARDNLLLTATQSSLEEQAERERFLKERIIQKRTTTTREEEVIMDHFSVEHRKEFQRQQESTWSSLDSVGLFSVSERCQLILGLLERIYIKNDRLQKILLGGAGNKKIKNFFLHETEEEEAALSLRYILQSRNWMDVLTPLHVDDQKLMVQKQTWYPLWKIMPPVDRIQEYYGPEIAFYFAFVGFLGQWLGMLGILGLSTFLFRKYRNDTIDEDEYTPFYGLFCFIWAIIMYRCWERQEHVLAYRWGTLDIGPDFVLDKGLELEHPRPEFHGIVRFSPVTGKPELYFPRYRRQLQYCVSFLVTSVMLAVAFSVMILSLNLQGYIRPKSTDDTFHPFYFHQFAVLSEDGALFDANSNWNCFIPTILHVLCISILNIIYSGVATKLTDWENHATQRAYDNSLILKRFLFEAFDCYVALFYLAFYERNVERLHLELVTVFNIDSFRRVFMEDVVPMLLHRCRGKNRAKEGHPHDLDLDEYESFVDYMEILIGFGYVTLFASAYPLASLIMFAAVWLEIRCDMYKLTHLCQKPPVGLDRVANIGMWKSLLQCMIWLSCITNCLLFGFTSDQMMHYMPQLYERDQEGVTHLVEGKGRYTILIIFGLERILICLGLSLFAMISVVPEGLVIKMKRRRYLLHQLASSKKKNE